MGMIGKKIRTRVHHAKMAKNARGTVTSVHQGVFYGVAVGGGTAYVPAFHAEPDADDIGGGTGGTPAPDPDGDAPA
jgi:hypothetical protein